MSDKLVFEVDSAEAERHLKSLTLAATELGKAFQNTRGATSALKELRMLLVGLRGQRSAFDELTSAIAGLNTGTESLKKSFAASIGHLGRVLKDDLGSIRDAIRMGGLAIGQAATDGIESGVKSRTGKVKKTIDDMGKEAIAAAKSVAVAMNNATGSYTRYTPSTGLKGAGVNNAGVAGMFMNMPSKADWQLATEKLVEEAKAAQLSAQAQVKAATIKATGTYSKVSSGSTVQVKNAELFMNMPSKADWQMATTKLVEEAKAAQISAQAQVKAATIQAVGSYSGLSTGRLYQVRNAELFMNMPSKADWQAATAKLIEEAKVAQLSAQAQVKAATLQAVGSYSKVSSGTTVQVKNAELFMNMPSKADWQIATRKLVEEAKAAQASALMQVRAATSQSTAPFQKYNASTMTPGAVMNVPKALPKPAELTGVAAALDTLTISGNNAHSMARGLASGFGLLWLTWGNLLPLFAGATISNGFVQTAKTGMEVAHTMETIAVLGGNTTKEMESLNKELDRLGRTGPFGPLAIADSMKVLSLAGLKANEILAVTQDVLNFSIAGTTDLKTAADTLVSVSTAFGMGAAGFSRVSDVISKAAAESKTSVESFANAMKTASVINKQYGVSLEDTATGIAALSQLGIEGTAAGTALRNMYADLSGRSIKVSKILKEQGIEMRTVTGEFRPMIDVVAELSTKLEGLTGIGQKNLLQAILSERGAKGIVELLELINSRAKDLGKDFPNALAEMRSAIADSYGFAAISAAKLSQTLKSQFDGVKASLSSSMNEAYKAAEPALALIAQKLREIFNSPEFIANLTTMVTNVAQLGLSFVKLTAFISDNLGAIALAAVAYAALTRYVSMKATATAADTLATDLNTKATLRNNMAKGGALASMARFLPGVGTAVTLLAVGWSMVDFWMSKSKDTAAEADNLYNSSIIKSLKDQADRLDKLNALRVTGITLTEAQAKLDRQAQSEEAVKPASNEWMKASNEAQRLNQEFMRRKADYERTEGTGPLPLSIEALGKASQAAASKSLEAYAKVAKAREAFKTQSDRVISGEMGKADWLKAEAAQRAALAKFGPGEFEVAAPGAGRKTPEERVGQNYLTELQTLIANKKDELAVDVKLTESAKLRNKYESAFKAGKLDVAGYTALKAVLEELAPLEQALAAKTGKKLVDSLLGDSENIPDYAQKLSTLNAALAQGKITTDEFTRANAALVAQGPFAKLREQVLAAKNAMDDYLTSAQKVADRNLAGLGMGAQERAKASGLSSIQDKFDQDALNLARKEAKDTREAGGTLSDSVKKQYADETEIIRQGRAEAVRIHEESNAKILESNANWATGASRALKDYASNAANVASGIESAMSSALKGMEDALVSFVTTGKADFKSLATSIISEIIRIQVRANLSSMLGGSNGASGFLGSVISSLMGGGGAATTSAVSGWGSVTATPLAAMAKGGAFDSPSLSRYSNQVHDTPQMFAFAKGAGVFGEAGPEAIMPLTRTPSGDLGVRTTGGGGGTSNMTINVEVINQGQPAQAEATAEKQPDGSMLIRVMLKAVAEDISSGGSTSRAIQHRFQLPR